MARTMTNEELLKADKRNLHELARQEQFILKMCNTPRMCGRCGGRHSVIEAWIAVDPESRTFEDWDPKACHRDTDAKCPTTNEWIRRIVPFVGDDFFMGMSPELATADEEPGQ